MRTEGIARFLWKSARYVLYWSHRAPVAEDDPQRLAVARAWVRRRRAIYVSVVIPTYGDPALVTRCVESLRGSGVEQVLVVDDGSPAEVQKVLARLPCTVILLPNNRGFAAAVIAGMRATDPQSDIVVMNSDVEARPWWLDQLKFCAYRDKRVGILGPKLLYPNGTIQSAGSFRNQGAPAWFDHYYRYQPAAYPPADVQRDVLAVTGACMYIKRAVVDAIGTFDPAYPMAFEDVDYCLRAWQAGFRVVYCPHAVLTHLESASRGKRQGPRELASRDRFWKTWGSFLDARSVRTSAGKLRVVYVLQKTNVAGGHRDVFEHLNALHDLGHDAALYTLEGPPRWFHLRAPVKTFLTYGQLVKALEDVPAIKVATWWETADPVWRASFHVGIPVYFIQDFETSYYDPTQHRERARVIASYRKEFHTLALSRWVQDALADVGLNAELMPPWYDDHLFCPDDSVSRQRDVLLALGRSHPLKNFSMTARAWKAMRLRPRLRLFGIEPEVAKGLTGAKYALRPSDQEVANLYRSATVFVQTSRHEGFGLPLLEAMACGCPVVCTDAGGNRDFCRDEENCLIVPQDDTAALARTLTRLFTDPKLQERLRQGGYETAVAYTPKHLVPRLEDFYLRLASRGAPIAGSPFRGAASVSARSLSYAAAPASAPAIST